MTARRTIVDLTDFRATDTQWRFLMDEDSRIKGMIGGLGSGKTRTGAEAFVDLVLSNPGCEHLMAGPTHEMTRDLCVPAFEQAMPKGMIVRYAKSEKRYDLRGGRSVKHGSADNPSSLEGRNIAGFWSDETRYWPVASWRNIVARLRERRARRLQGIVTTTPAMGWLAEEFDAQREGRTTYRASTRENAHNLAPGYIDDLARTYSPRLFKSLVEGHFSVVAGQVYEEFDDARHAVDWEYDPRLRTGLGIDFGVACPSVLVWQQTGVDRILPGGRIMPAGSIVIFDELHPDNTPTARLVPAIAARLGGKMLGDRYVGGRRIDVIYCDPAGNARDQASGMPSVHLLRSAFGEVVRYTTAPAETWIPNGVARVQGALSPADGSPPRLYVARGLLSGGKRGVVKSLRGYLYPEAKGNRPQSDVPIHDPVHSHAMDALRYAVVGLHLDRGGVGAETRRETTLSAYG